MHKEVSFGKRGVLRLCFERDDKGRSILRELYRETPVIVQQALYFDEALPSLPCVYILSSGGPVVAGDSYHYNILLREGACAHISTGAATKVAQMECGKATMRQEITLFDGTYLEYLPEPVIPCAGACYEAMNQIIAAPSATLFLANIFLCGRRFSGESFRYRRLDLATHILRPDGRMIFCDRQVIEPPREDVAMVGIMAQWEVFATVLMIAPKDIAQTLYSAIIPYNDEHIALGVHMLPYDAGVQCRVLGHESQRVKRVVRELCSRFRQSVLGVPLQEEFVWR